MLHPPQADDAAAAGGERHGQLRLAGAGGGYGLGLALVGGGRGGPDGLRRRALLMMFRAMAAAVVVCSVTGMVALDSCVPPAQEHLLGIA